MISITNCVGSPDYELSGPPRNVSYRVSHPPGTSKGLIFFVACFGLDNEYIDNWLGKASEKYQMHAICVEYHCFYSRPEQGATISFTQRSTNELIQLCHKWEIKYDLNRLNEAIHELGSRLPGKERIEGVELVPKDRLYQNFGVVQALDHLYVIADLCKSGTQTNWSNIIFFGSSHGGYISHMVNKFAPNTIRVIIDNSSYISPPPQYMGLGSEYYINFNNLLIGCSTKTLWQYSSLYEPTFYGALNRELRDTANGGHLREMSEKSSRIPSVIAYQSSTNDYISHPDNKKYQRDQYEKEGFYYDLRLIRQEDIDGKLFKSLCHGMDASLWDLFCHAMAGISDMPSTKNVIDHLRETILRFETSGGTVIIKHSSNSIKAVEMEIQKTRHI